MRGLRVSWALGTRFSNSRLCSDASSNDCTNWLTVSFTVFLVCLYFSWVIFSIPIFLTTPEENTRNYNTHWKFLLTSTLHSLMVAVNVYESVTSRSCHPNFRLWILPTVLAAAEWTDGDFLCLLHDFFLQSFLLQVGHLLAQDIEEMLSILWLQLDTTAILEGNINYQQLHVL